MTKLKTLLRFIITPVVQKSRISDFTFSLIRFLCGVGISIAFGASKFGVPWTDKSQNLNLFEVAAWFPEDVKVYGGLFAIFPVFFAWIGAFSEAIGGVFFQKWNNGLWQMLPAISFLWVAIYNIALGSGRFGIDYLISKNLK